MPRLIQIVRDLEGQGAGFQSLSEDINTTTAGGGLVLHLMGALAEFERSLIMDGALGCARGLSQVMPDGSQDV